jgi:uncharacterized protein (TIGR02246 family)
MGDAMPRTFLVPVALVGALSLIGCAQQPAPPAAAVEPVRDAPADIAALNAAREAFMTGYEAGDAAAIGQLYMPDAISESNNQPSLVGRDAIVASLKGMFEQVTVKTTLTPAETRTLGNVGLDRGTYTVTVTPKAGAPPSTSEGRYMVIYVKDADGTWRVSRDMDNGVMPPAPAAAAEPNAGARK